VLRSARKTGQKNRRRVPLTSRLGELLLFRSRLQLSNSGFRVSYQAKADRTWMRVASAFVVASLVWPGLSSPALAADANGDDEDDAGPYLPNVYLDYRTAFSALPPGVVAFGFRGFSALSVSSAASQALTFDFPLTIDLTETLSLYGGPTTSTSRTDTSRWRHMTLDSWNIGFQADVYQQNGGWFPTVTIQSTLTRSIPASPLAATSTTTIGELGYALDEDETRGLLTGVQYTNVFFDSDLPKVRPTVVGYLGGYYQWDNNWKFTGRVGVQSFGGAQLLNIQPIQPFTQPIVRLDLEKLDDRDNRVFGVTAEVAWTPKLAFQLVLRTPLYMVKN
jgi:hypothetical protein